MKLLEFTTLFDYEKFQLTDKALLESLNNIVIPIELQNTIEAHDTNWYNAVINGIICVESDGDINNDRVTKSKRSQQRFNRLPLKGLSKVHIRIPGVQHIAKQLGLELNIEDGDIKKNTIFTLCSDLLKVQNAVRTFQIKRERQRITGCWLIYGTLDGKRYYLDIFDGTSHNSDNLDQSILDELNRKYEPEFISKFLQP